MPIFHRKPQEKNTDSGRTPPFTGEEDLRSEFMVSEAQKPKRVYKPHASYMTPARYLKLTLGLVTLFLTWFLFMGPGRPTFDLFVSSLDDFTISLPKAPNTPTVTLPTLSPSATLYVMNTLPPTTTVTPTKTPATLTPAVAAPTDSPTITITPTSGVVGCIPALAVKLEDVGKVLCVTGSVLRTDKNENGFLITLENPKDAFFFISYERSWDKLRIGTCVFATGEIKRLGNAPVMILNYQVDLEFCP